MIKLRQKPNTGKGRAAPAKKRAPPKPGRKLSEFERYKLKMQRRKKLRMLCGIALVTAVMAAVVVGIGALTGTGLPRLQNTPSSLYPRPLVGSSVRAIEPLGWSIALLDTSDLTVYDSKGVTTLSIHHGYAAPVLKTDGGRLLLYDQGGTKFIVASATREISRGTAPAAIHAADICQNGTFALVTSSSKNATLATFYDSYGNKGTWSSGDLATSIALSPDGKQAAISLIGAEDGALVTSVVLRNLSGGEGFPPVKVRDEMGAYVLFKQQSIMLVSDKSAKQIDFSGRVRNSFEYGGRQILQFADGGPGHTVLVLGGPRYMRGSEVVALDDKCGKLGQFSTDATIESLRANDQGIFFLSGGEVRHCDYSAKFSPSVAVSGAIRFLPLAQDLYVATYEDLRKLPIL